MPLEAVAPRRVPVQLPSPVKAVQAVVRRKARELGARVWRRRDRVGQREAALAAKREKEKDNQHDNCKERPSSNLGSGGSRSYIPWC